jgi:hypothetical protein
VLISGSVPGRSLRLTDWWPSFAPTGNPALIPAVSTHLWTQVGDFRNTNRGSGTSGRCSQERKSRPSISVAAPSKRETRSAPPARRSTMGSGPLPAQGPTETMIGSDFASAVLIRPTAHRRAAGNPRCSAWYATCTGAPAMSTSRSSRARKARLRLTRAAAPSARDRHGLAPRATPPPSRSAWTATAAI